MENIERLRKSIEEQYNIILNGSTFEEILCYELYQEGATFSWLAMKWGISITTFGDLISDHCHRLEPLPKVNHSL